VTRSLLSITNANLTIDEAIQAVRDNNSTETLQLLTELRSDLVDINGNVANLIFSVAAQPP
jgi:type II secretory pathway component PulF